MWRPSPQPMPRPQRNRHGNHQHKPSWQYLWWPWWLPLSVGRDSEQSVVSVLLRRQKHSSWKYYYHCWCFHTDPNTHETVLENNPGQEKDKSFVAAVEGRDISGGQFLQGHEVQVVGQCPQDWEGCCSLYEKLESHPILPKELAALPVWENKPQKVKGSDVNKCFPLGTASLFICLAIKKTKLLGWKCWLLSCLVPHGQKGGLKCVPGECKEQQGRVELLSW